MTNIILIMILIFLASKLTIFNIIEKEFGPIVRLIFVQYRILREIEESTGRLSIALKAASLNSYILHSLGRL